jgi:hypothetical protein
MSAPTLTDKQRELLRDVRLWSPWGAYIGGGPDHAAARALKRRGLVRLRRLRACGSVAVITAKGLRALTAARGARA